MIEGKTAIVTGASRGIGAAIARSYLENGANVMINCRSKSKALAEITEEFAPYGDRVDYAVGDVADKSFVTDMVKQTQSKFGSLDVLVNNAGTIRDKPLSFMRDEEWDAVIETNLRGPYLCSKAAVKPMMRARWGRIINIASISALAGRPGQTNYAAAKAGLIGFTKSLAREMAPHNVLANSVVVGVIDTRMTKAIPRDTLNEIKGLVPMGRVGQPHEVAGACLFLASDLSSYVTGSSLNVSGGGYM